MAMYECYDDNFFATKFHIDIFTRHFEDDRDIAPATTSLNKTSWLPMEYIKTELQEYKGMEKEDIILFIVLIPRNSPKFLIILQSKCPNINL